MKPFYSILQVPTRPAGQEQLNIGLLLVGDSASYFHFSNKKLEFVKKLIPDNSYILLRSYLFNLAEKIKTENDDLRSRFRNTDFISYLSVYNNNLITFSKPLPIDIEVNERTYQTLFEKFIFPIELDVEEKGELQKTDSLHKLKAILKTSWSILACKVLRRRNRESIRVMKNQTGLSS